MFGWSTSDFVDRHPVHPPRRSQPEVGARPGHGRRRAAEQQDDAAQPAQPQAPGDPRRQHRRLRGGGAVLLRRRQPGMGVAAVVLAHLITAEAAGQFWTGRRDSWPRRPVRPDAAAAPCATRCSGSGGKGVSWFGVHDVLGPLGDLARQLALRPARVAREDPHLGYLPRQDLRGRVEVDRAEAG